MSKKYHFNTKTGNPNICRAEKNCPFGGAEVHYPTKEGARKGYENRQEGSFKKAPPKRKTPGLWSTKEEYYDAPVSSVVIFANNVRFVKKSRDGWETSTDGGLILNSEGMEAYPSSQGIAFGGQVIPPEQEEQKVQAPTAKAPVQGTIKATTLRNAAHEQGTEARRTFLLINHRDPKQIELAEAAGGNKELLSALRESNKLKAREKELRNAFDKAAKRAQESKTQAQHDGYARVMEKKAQELAVVRESAVAVEGIIETHGKGLAKQLVIHKRSLDSIERLANQGIKSALPGAKARMQKLEEIQKKVPSVRPLREKFETRKADAVLSAAQEFGNPIYVARAERFVAANAALDALNSEAAALQHSFNSVSSPQVQTAIQEAMLSVQQRQRGVAREFEESVADLKLFHDDLLARGTQEQDVRRELNALRKITSA